MDDSIRTIADELEAGIASLERGAKLPSEHALMDRFDATRNTVRRALDRLEAKFLVRRVQGAGTFVNRRTDYVLSSRRAPSLHETIASGGGRVRTFVADVSRDPVQGEIAARLDIEPGTTCLHLTRVGYVEDELVTYAEEWISPHAVPDIDLRLRAFESIIEILRGAGAEPVRAWTRASPDFAPSQLVERLASKALAPVWRLETLTTDGARGRPLMHSTGWMRQDRINVVVEFEHAE